MPPPANPAQPPPPLPPLPPRQRQLLDEVRAHGPITVERLATRFAVTPQTIRRDVSTMARAGLVARYHGGVALPASATDWTHSVPGRSGDGSGAAGTAQVIAARISARIAADIPDGSSLLLAAGPVAPALARALGRHRHLRVVTNDLDAATLLARQPGCEVIVCGGQVRPGDRGLIGDATIDAIRRVRVDIGLIGVAGIDADGSLRDFDPHQVGVVQAIIDASADVWLGADADVFSRRALVQVATLAQVNALYTDRLPPATMVRRLDADGVRCVVAESATT